MVAPKKGVSKISSATNPQCTSLVSNKHQNISDHSIYLKGSHHSQNTVPPQGLTPRTEMIRNEHKTMTKLTQKRDISTNLGMSTAVVITIRDFEEFFFIRKIGVTIGAKKRAFICSRDIMASSKCYNS